MKKTTVKNYIQKFEQEADATLENYSTLKTIWSDLDNLTDDNTEKVTQEVDRVRDYQAQLEKKVNSDKESRQTSFENVCRQKFDYFPFLEAIARKAYKRGLLEDEEKPKSNKKQKTAKNTTKLQVK